MVVTGNFLVWLNELRIKKKNCAAIISIDYPMPNKSRVYMRIND